jgi:hypothetical protein
MQIARQLPRRWLHIKTNLQSSLQSSANSSSDRNSSLLTSPPTVGVVSVWSGCASSALLACIDKTIIFHFPIELTCNCTTHGKISSQSGVHLAQVRQLIPQCVRMRDFDVISRRINLYGVISSRPVSHWF